MIITGELSSTRHPWNLISFHKFSLFSSVILVRIKTQIAIAASLIDRFATSVASVRGYGLQIVCSFMIYEQRRTTADYNGDSPWNWLDENYCWRAPCRSRKKRLNRSSRVLFLIHPCNLRGDGREIFQCIVKKKRRKQCVIHRRVVSIVSSQFHCVIQQVT